GDGTSIPNGTFAYFREWNAVIGDFSLEFNSRTAINTSNLVTDTPLRTDFNDLTANHNNWTPVGINYTFVTDDPIPVGCVASDAITIPILPYNTTYNIKPTNVEYIFNQWYKYTAVAPEVYIGGWFWGDLANYAPRTDIFSDAGITDYPPTD